MGGPEMAPIPPTRCNAPRLSDVRLASLPDITVYCDGACSGNPGPGGWAALILEGDTERVVSGAEPRTTNQRMEIRAALEGLAAIPECRRVHVHSDSAYVVNCFRDRWWERWERTGWIGTNKQPVANRDLWERLLVEMRRHDVQWHKVRGHSGDPLNERVDTLARRADRVVEQGWGERARLRTWGAPGAPQPPWRSGRLGCAGAPLDNANRLTGPPGPLLRFGEFPGSAPPGQIAPRSGEALQGGMRERAAGDGGSSVLEVLQGRVAQQDGRNRLRS